MQLQKQQQIESEVRQVSSQYKDWVVWYLASQSRGLAELACDKELIPNSDRKRMWRDEVIFRARTMRKELFRRYGLVLFDDSIVMTQDGEWYEYSQEFLH